MGCFYKEIKLIRKQCGIYIITNKIKTRMMTIFIKHTSTLICINKNVDSTERKDFNYFLNKIVPENDPKYNHIIEGPDDMPAHTKSTLIENSIEVSTNKGMLSLGTSKCIIRKNSCYNNKLLK